jgi:hypothetical protein
MNKRLSNPERIRSLIPALHSLIEQGAGTRLLDAQPIDARERERQ